MFTDVHVPRWGRAKRIRGLALTQHALRIGASEVRVGVGMGTGSSMQPYWGRR